MKIPRIQPIAIKYKWYIDDSHEIDRKIVMDKTDYDAEK